MLTMLVVAFAVLTVATLLQARQVRATGKTMAALPWLIGSMIFGLITCTGVWTLAREPKLLWWVPPNGFGVEWQCTENVPPSARVCFRH